MEKFKEQLLDNGNVPSLQVNDLLQKRPEGAAEATTQRWDSTKNLNLALF